MEKEVKLTVSVRSIFKLVMFCVTTTTRTCDEQKISTQSRKKTTFFMGNWISIRVYIYNYCLAATKGREAFNFFLVGYIQLLELDEILFPFPNK